MSWTSFILNNKIELKKQYLLSILVVCLVAALCFACSAYIGPEVVAFILLVTLSVIAMFFVILPVLVTALLSALIWDYFFLTPRFRFQVKNTEDEIMLSMYFVIASINAVLTFKIRQVEKLARTREEKARALKLYKTLLNSLSHEFRTPIATIIGSTDNLLTNSALSDNDKEKLLSEISIASLRLNRQVENLLNMSRLESGVIEPKKDWCDVNELIVDVIQGLDEQLKNHQVEIDVKDNFPLFRIDYGLMEQVLYNLVHNASQYTPQGSRIKICADCSGEQLLIAVEDNGIGLPEDETGKVFEKFYRPKHAPAGGTGLGLSIVKGFVEAHNGTVGLENKPLHGARFVLNIPAEKLLLNHTEK
jgi:two-component system sensor histidine kinase KdpD